MSIKKKVSLLKSLLYLLAITKNGNMTITAEQNGIKISNLSRTIKDLEANTGFKLLNRKSNGVSLTEAGKKFVSMISSLESDLLKLENIGEQSRHIKDSIILSLPQNFILNHFEDFSVSYPGINVKIVADEDSYDVGLFYSQPSAKSNFEIAEFVVDNRSLAQTIWITYDKSKQSACLLYDFIICQLHL